MASFNVHVNARSLLYRQTHMTMQSGVIAGASNAGLKDPGVHTAYSIGQLTALLVPEPVTAIDDLVILNVIIRLRKAAAKGFAKARKRLDLEHAEQRGLLIQQALPSADVIDLNDYSPQGQRDE